MQTNLAEASIGTIHLDQIVLIISFPHLLDCLVQLCNPVRQEIRHIVAVLVGETSLQIRNLLAHFPNRGGCRFGKFVPIQLNETRVTVLLVRPQVAVDATCAARLLVLPRAHVAHQTRLAIACAARRFVNAAPDFVLSLIVKVTLAVVARLPGSVALADRLALLIGIAFVAEIPLIAYVLFLEVVELAASAAVALPLVLKLCNVQQNLRTAAVFASLVATRVVPLRVLEALVAQPARHSVPRSLRFLAYFALVRIRPDVLNGCRHDGGIVSAVVRIAVVVTDLQARISTQIDLNPPMLGMRAAVLHCEELVAVRADQISNGLFLDVCTVVAESVDREPDAVVAAR